MMPAPALTQLCANQPPTSPSLTPQASYDELDDGALADALGFKDLRAQLLSQAKGQVLEVAVGTGLNLQVCGLVSGRAEGRLLEMEVGHRL